MNKNTFAPLVLLLVILTIVLSIPPRSQARTTIGTNDAPWAPLILQLEDERVPQFDTNSTTTTTRYTPRYVGDSLKGKQGGSNRIWRAFSGTTTNDWDFKFNAD